MPKRTDIHSVLIIGAGPIIIGQACEFDYSGTQACKALREEGYRVILINSNPATIMTDPEFADRTYIEPITPECVEKIIIREKEEMKKMGAKGKLVLLPTLGGQTALNTAMSLHKNGALERHDVEMIGAKPDAIHKGEDRFAFKELMLQIGLDVPISGVAHNLDEARAVAKKIGKFPLIIRPAFTLGGTGGGIGYNQDEFEAIAKNGIELSPVNEILIEESLLGWKEYEMEVMRDKADNCVIICSIENFDPMGVHTGDSITVAPIQTLTDKEFQIMRDQSFAVIRAVGVETGGSNIQFGVSPENGRMVIIEMNPRVSRSSALASKATGFPIAKIAAKLAVGYLLDELKNDITRETPASFEPSIDYVVTKIPRFAFEKFPQADPTLTTQMKSVGEAMAIGRTFKESLQKCLRSLEIGRSGLGGDGKPWRIGTEVYGDRDILPRDVISRKLSVPNAERIFFIRHALRAGFTIEEIFNLTKIDRWFWCKSKRLWISRKNWPPPRIRERVAKDFESGNVSAMKTLVAKEEQFLTDAKGKRTGVVLDLKTYEHLREAEEELADIHAYDALHERAHSEIEISAKVFERADVCKRIRKPCNPNVRINRPFLIWPCNNAAAPTESWKPSPAKWISLPPRSASLPLTVKVGVPPAGSACCCA
jgi:carbamoyl-phosphate synthase large subunit